jgi:hypothetical protein
LSLWPLREVPELKKDKQRIQDYGGRQTPVALALQGATGAQENILKLSIDGVAVVRQPSCLILVAHALPVVPGKGAAGRASLKGAVHAALRVEGSGFGV